MNNKHFDRRKFVKTFGLGLASLPVAGLVGCNADGTTTGTNSSSTNANTTGTPPTGTPPTGTPTTSSQAAQYCTYTTNTSEWATGGVANLTVSFPDTSIFNNASTCAVTMAEQTLGPCFFAVETGEDIAGTKDGIPMQICLQVVDANCTPIANAQVEIWHCDRAGVYSADESNSSESGNFQSNFCSGGNENAENAKWFRGVLMTDGEGRVSFKSCFPGWYSGRTAHIHFRIKQNSQVSLISQFCFEDSLTEAIYTTHPAYSCRGNQDTTLASGKDTVFGSMYQNYIMSVSKNTDNSMLVYKRIMLTS